MAMAQTIQRGNVKSRVGRVVSHKMDKTILVAIDRLVQHRLYKKTIRRTRRIMAHDEENRCQIGDKVRLIETRPLSKNKRWRVNAILERAK